MTLLPRSPLIYLISDGSINDENHDERSARLLELMDAAVRSRIPLVQIREKNLSGRNLFDLASRAAKITHGTETRLLINDRLDIALASGADGVHLTANSFTPNAVRRIVPDGFVIGVSTHHPDEIDNAKKAGADFAVFGPVYQTPGKGSAAGIEKLTEIVQDSDPFPVLALGGINERNYLEVLRTGVAGIAAIRFLNNAANLEMLSKELDL